MVAIHRGEALANAVAPATDIARVIPLPAVAFRQGMSIVTDHQMAIKIFNALGTATVAGNDEEFAAMQAAGCVMGHFYKTLKTTGDWMKTHGVNDDTAAKYITGINKTFLAEAVHRAE